MDDNQLLKTIIQNTYTKGDFLRRLNLLRGFLEQQFFKSEATLEKYLKNIKASPLDQKALLSWGKEFYSSFDVNSLYQKLNTLSKGIKSIQNITLYIPLDSTDKDIDVLGAWFRQNISKSALIDLRFDKKRIGGCAVVLNNVYRDYSLHHFMNKNKTEVLDMLSTYQLKTQSKPTVQSKSVNQ